MNPIDMTPLVRQQLLLDIMPEQASWFWEGLELVPPSPDVLPLLQDESSKRMAKVMPLAPVCEMYIAFTAEIISRAMYSHLLAHIPEEDLPARQQAAELLPPMTGQNREVVRAALYATLAHLVDGGFVTITGLPQVSPPSAPPGSWPG